jgi:phytoene dehydrogenase-like protein
LNCKSVVDWASHKRELEAFVLTRLGKLLPGIQDRMVVRLSATARTHERYTWNRDGAMLGWEMSPDQLAAMRPDLSGLVRGLFMVGHWTRPGGGITPVMVSAMEVARRVTAERLQDDCSEPRIRECAWNAPVAAS